MANLKWPVKPQFCLKSLWKNMFRFLTLKHHFPDCLKFLDFFIFRNILLMSSRAQLWGAELMRNARQCAHSQLCLLSYSDINVFLALTSMWAPTSLFIVHCSMGGICLIPSQASPPQHWWGVEWKIFGKSLLEVRKCVPQSWKTGRFWPNFILFAKSC